MNPVFELIDAKKGKGRKITREDLSVQMLTGAAKKAGKIAKSYEKMVKPAPGGAIALGMQTAKARMSKNLSRASKFSAWAATKTAKAKA